LNQELYDRNYKYSSRLEQQEREKLITDLNERAENLTDVSLLEIFESKNGNIRNFFRPLIRYIVEKTPYMIEKTIKERKIRKILLIRIYEFLETNDYISNEMKITKPDLSKDDMIKFSSYEDDILRTRLSQREDCPVKY